MLALLAFIPQNMAFSETLQLPEPSAKGGVSLEEALNRRRSIRDFKEQGLSLVQIGQLLWAAQGITEPTMGFRTAPSAGALYPLEVYLAQKDGVYRYLPKTHSLIKAYEGDRRRALFLAGLLQGPILRAPVSFVVTAVYARTEAKYGDRAKRYVHLEAGHAAQNLLLQASAMGLGGVSIGAFVDSQVQRAVGLPKDHAPLYIIPVGYPD